MFASRGSMVYLGKTALLAALYVLMAKIAFGLAFVHTSISPVWLPSGLAVAAAILFGYRASLGVFIGAFAFNASTEVPWWVAVLVAAGNTLEAVSATWLLRRVRFQPAMGRVHDVLALAGMGALIPTAVSATTGVATLLVAGVLPAGDAGTSWVLWWSGDAVGVLTLTPILLLAWSTRREHFRPTGRRVAEATALAIVLPLAVGLGLMSGVVGPFLAFPALVWAAIRFRQPGANLASLFGVAVIVAATAHRIGPFVQPTLLSSLLLTQSYVAVMMATSLLLAAMTVERERGHLALHRANRELERERAQLGEAQRIAHVGSWSWERTTDSVEWSDETYRVFGLAPSETPIHYDDFLARVHADDQDRLREAVTRTLTDGTPLLQEYRIVRPDGVVRIVHGRGVAVTDASGEIVALWGTTQDITERKRSEQELSAQQQRTRAIIATASDMFFGVDVRGLITDWNRAAESTFGWSTHEALGRSLVDLIIPARDRAARHECLIAAVSDPDGHPLDQHVEITACRRDGTELSVELAAWLIESAEGRQLNAFARDVTDRKRAAQALAAARDQAVEASQLKSRFLATMSHEIRTPMNGVIGLAELLLDGHLDPTQRPYAEGIRTAGTALLTVINDVLDLSKLEADKIVLDSVAFEPDAVIADVVALLAETARTRGLTLTTTRDAQLPGTLRGDPGRLRQILLNLVSNAVRFTEHGGVVVHAALADPLTGDGTCAVRIEVRDTGIGIPPELQGHIFDPFVQADASTSRSYGGTGLGLTIAGELARIMGGALGVDSEPGLGSTFWLALRLGITDAAAPPTPAVAARPDELRGRHVLLVEDNDTNRIVATGFLTKLGCTLDIAGNGAEAIDRAQQGAYDLVFMDCQMPHMDGYTAAAMLRELDGPTRHIPIIALTASVLAEDRERCLVAGMDDFVAKPVTIAELGAALERWSCPDGLRRSIELREQPVLDMDRLADIGGTEPIDAGLMRHLIGTFLTSAPAHLARIAAAVPAADATLVEHHAHTLKGMSASLGADGMAALAARLEALGRTGDISTAVETVADLHTELHRTRSALGNYLSGIETRSEATATVDP